MPASAVQIASTVVLGVLIETGAADWTLVAPVVVSGFTYLSVGWVVRARWSYGLEGRPELTTAYSLESALDEVIFTLGPLMATVIATQIAFGTWVFVGMCRWFVGAGAVWLQSPARHRAARGRGRRAAASQSALRYRGHRADLILVGGRHGCDVRDRRSDDGGVLW